MLVFKSRDNLSDDQLKKEREKIIEQIESGKILLLNGRIEFIGSIPDESDKIEVVNK